MTAVIILLGLIVSSALKGYAAPSLSTLAWDGYDASITPRPWWTWAIEYIVILFPAINMITTAPPFAIALAENLFSYFNSQSKKLRIGLRVAVWIIPTIIALIIYDMGKSGAFAGLISYYTIFVSNAYIFIVSKRQVPIPTPYEGWHSKDCVAWTIIGFSILLFLVNAFYLFYG